MKSFGIILCLCLAALSVMAGPDQKGKAKAKRAKAEPSEPAYDASVPAPTVAGVTYGPHERNVLDLWLVESDETTPLVVVIHGGGWNGGSKERVNRFVDVDALLEAGISVAAINYRLIPMAREQGIEPPVKAPLHDAARSIQFLRAHADEWNIDGERIGAAGGSAGACSSLWLAFRDDLADPDADDAVLRESSRIHCAAVTGAQTTLDPHQMRKWMPNSRYGGHAFGLGRFDAFHAARDEILPWIEEYSPYSLVTPDDPPVFLRYGGAPDPGKPQRDPTHSANFGQLLLERCRELAVECVLSYPGARGVKWDSPTAFLIAKLTEGN